MPNGSDAFAKDFSADSGMPNGSDAFANGPSEDTKPAADTKPAEDKAAADTNPPKDTPASRDTKPAEEKAAPADTKPAEDTKATPKGQPVADTKPQEPAKQDPAKADPAKDAKEKSTLQQVNDDVTKGAKVVKTATTLINEGGKLAKAASNTPLTRAAGVAGTVANAAQLPGAVAKATNDVGNAINDPTKQNIDKAIGSAASATKGVVGTTKDALNTAGKVASYQAAREAAKDAFKAAAPKATEAVAEAASKAVAQKALEGASRQVARATGRALAGEAGQAAATAARAAVKAGAGGALAKAAGRFAPGANVAIAALDVANAYSTISDPNASTGKKIFSGVTALGSVAAATNIPVVSQVGAVVSSISGLIGAFW